MCCAWILGYEAHLQAGGMPLPIISLSEATSTKPDSTKDQLEARRAVTVVSDSSTRAVP